MEIFLRFIALVMGVFGLVVLIDMIIDRTIAIWVGIPMCIIIIFCNMCIRRYDIMKLTIKKQLRLDEDGYDELWDIIHLDGIDVVVEEPSGYSIPIFIF